MTIDKRRVAVAGHTGDIEGARLGLESSDPSIRATALGALERLGTLEDADIASSLDDPAPAVRRRAAQIAARRTDVDLLGALHDPDPSVVEMAAWACGEHENDRAEIVAGLVALAGSCDDPLVREAAVAALGAIGSEDGREAILAATGDRPAVRRRAVLALAPFVGDDVDEAIERALEDRDWQVRQAAEDLRRATR